MMKSVPVYALFLIVVFYTSCKGQNKIDLLKDAIEPQSKITSHEFYSVTRNTVEAGKDVIIQNSYPKGGVAINGNGGYTDFTGKTHGFGIFWTRVINETATPIELNINFPADSFPVSPSPDSYVKLFLPPDTMTLDKQSLYNYGYKITDLRSFLDTSFNKPTMFRRTVNPKEESLFYIVLLMKVPDNGPVRTELISKDKNLFYKISILPHFDSVLIPCGHIIIK
ncbi:MAG: hypothetical protein H7Z72_02470 [Bacteroidetes bacterium]|nr:hypothetical protein [Fibrella sp.]